MFRSARISLTAWYVLVVMTISLMFSLVIFLISWSEVRHVEQVQRLRFQQNLERNGCISPDLTSSFFPPSVPISSGVIEESRERIVWTLISVNVALFFLSTLFSYLLAGKTLSPIQEMVEEQHRFISDASHEFRTPLASLKTGFEVFLRSPKQSFTEAKTLIKESLIDVNNLQYLSDSLLQLARFENPQYRETFSSVDIKETVSQAIRKVRNLAKQKQISIIDESKSVFVRGNPLQLENVLMIFLENAIKYSGEKTRIHIQHIQHQKMTTLKIVDQGQGISPQEIEKVFHRFYRANSARSKSGAGGYGLGLSIAEKIINHHKGRIQVSSKVGLGTTVAVTLPLHSSRQQAALE